MKILFLHQNAPGQYRHLAPALARDDGNEVVFITQPGKPDLPGIRKIEYKPHRKVAKGIHGYLASSEAAVLNAQGVARVCFDLRAKGFVPDVIIGNPGWGETLFVKDVWPGAKLISLCEFYYGGAGSDIGFDPEFPSGPDAVLRARVRSGPLLLALEAADRAYAPTHWQKSRFPIAYHDKIEIIHDGIDVYRVRPDENTAFDLPGGAVLTREDEVLTYVSRNLEPYRGFHTLMRSLPEILERRPEAHVVIVGGDEVSYGARAPDGKSWKDVMLEEVGPMPDRVHFAGRIPYSRFLSLLQISSAHVYLTYPFVLSWSMLEAMSAGCIVIGSKTAPVEEVIEDGVNGRSFDFFDAGALASVATEVLEHRHDFAEMRRAARATVIDRYALDDCLAAQRDLIARTLQG